MRMQRKRVAPMTTEKSLETRRAELTEARRAVLNIYRPLLDAWQDGLSANELDDLMRRAYDVSRGPLRRYQRLRRIVELMTAQQQTAKEEKETSP